jgi:hypothetical protein
MLPSLQQQLSEAQENLRLIQERKAKFVLETEIPLQLIREERQSGCAIVRPSIYKLELLCYYRVGPHCGGYV